MPEPSTTGAEYMNTDTTMPDAVADEVFNAVACLWNTQTMARHKSAAEWVKHARRIEDEEPSARVVVLVYEAAIARADA